MPLASKINHLLRQNVAAEHSVLVVFLLKNDEGKDVRVLY